MNDRNNDRPHLSIGEVLSLLQDEFPDVTISKIRFLESQGLLDPERTPSGYRKFYEHDLARLRWILTQQRDNFLPLRVIKERLDSGFVPDEVRAGVASGTSPAGSGPAAGSAPSDATARPRAIRPVEASPAVAPEGPVGGRETGGDADHERAHGRGTNRNGTRPRPTPAPAEPAGGAGGRATAEGDPSGAGRGRNALWSGEVDEAGRASGDAAESQTRGPEPGRGGGPPATAGDRSEGNDPSRPADPARRRPGDVTALSMSLTELAAACGQTVADLHELERFGLIAGEHVGSSVVYREDALLVARLAARFGRHGIEPRHLRQYRVAAEREVALVEQVIAPFLLSRGRVGPAGDAAISGRRSALEAAEELSGLGEELRHVLVERGLRSYLDGT